MSTWFASLFNFHWRFYFCRTVDWPHRNCWMGRKSSSHSWAGRNNL